MMANALKCAIKRNALVALATPSGICGGTGEAGLAVCFVG
jgi:hypothetical protein